MLFKKQYFMIKKGLTLTFLFLLVFQINLYPATMEGMINVVKKFPPIRFLVPQPEIHTSVTEIENLPYNKHETVFLIIYNPESGDKEAHEIVSQIVIPQIEETQCSYYLVETKPEANGNFPVKPSADAIAAKLIPLLNNTGIKTIYTLLLGGDGTIDKHVLSVFYTPSCLGDDPVLISKFNKKVEPIIFPVGHATDIAKYLGHKKLKKLIKNINRSTKVTLEAMEIEQHFRDSPTQNFLTYHSYVVSGITEEIWPEADSLKHTISKYKQERRYGIAGWQFRTKIRFISFVNFLSGNIWPYLRYMFPAIKKRFNDYQKLIINGIETDVMLSLFTRMPFGGGIVKFPGTGKNKGLFAYIISKGKVRKFLRVSGVMIEGLIGGFLAKKGLLPITSPHPRSFRTYQILKNDESIQIDVVENPRKALRSGDLEKEPASRFTVSFPGDKPIKVLAHPKSIAAKVELAGIEDILTQELEQIKNSSKEDPEKAKIQANQVLDKFDSMIREMYRGNPIPRAVRKAQKRLVKKHAAIRKYIYSQQGCNIFTFWR